MINIKNRYYAIENSKLELEIDFVKLENGNINYQIISQNNLSSEEVTRLTDCNNYAFLDYDNILSEFLSQHNLRKYHSIVQKKHTIQERIFLPNSDIYLQVKLTPHLDNKALLAITFSKNVDNLNVSDTSQTPVFDDPLLFHKFDSSHLELKDLLNLDELNNLIRTFHKFYQIPVVIMDLEGNPLTSVGLSEICTKFHRQNPISRKRCLKNDATLTKDLKQDEIRINKCSNNMYDLATPLYIEDRHIANLFIGQFFYIDEEIDYDFYKNQAKRLNFDTKLYLKALNKVPRIDKNEVIHIISFYRDLFKIITTQAHSKLKLLDLTHNIKQREAILQQITDNMTDVVFTADFDHNLNLNINYISPSVQRLLGYTPAEYRKLRMEERYTPQTIELIKTILKAHLEKDNFSENKDKTFLHRSELYNKENQIVVTSIHSKFLRDTNNKPHALIANIRDITEQIKVENKLEQQLRLQSLLSAIAIKYINIPTQDIDKSLRESLAQMGEFVNADRAYIYEYDWEKQNCVLSYQWVAQEVSPNIKNMNIVPLKYLGPIPQKHKNGENFLIDDYSDLVIPTEIRKFLQLQNIQSQITIPILNHEECFGFVGFDSIRFKHFFGDAELTILSIFAKLLANITNRVILENNLRAERKRAQDSDTFKSNLLKTISHEFKTPLNGIVGFSELLQQLNNDCDPENMSRMIHTSAMRLNHVLDSIMLLTNLEDDLHENSVRLKTTNVSNILLEISNLYKDQFIAKNLTFHYEIQPNIFGKLDENLLKQALIQILNNALKFTHKGGAQLLCSSHHGKIIIDVIDSGVGIPQESIKFIFSKFRQVSEGYNRSYEGVGLGLPITKKIIDLMKGEISVKSKILEGSTFTITLPVGNIDQSTPKKVEENEKPRTTKIELSKPEVLVVEDNAINQKLAISILKKDFSTELATNGEDAILLAKKKKYDVILMDIHLGYGIDGLTTSNIIQKDTKNSSTPIIAVTGYTTHADKEKILTDGCDYYLAKPYTKNELLEIINKAISK